MPPLVEEVSTITATGQTTVSKAVRQALGLGYGGRIAFRVERDGGVTVRRAETEADDPVIARFLAFLARDLEHRPEAVAALGPELAARLDALTAGVEIELAAPIEGEVAL